MNSNNGETLSNDWCLFGKVKEKKKKKKFLYEKISMVLRETFIKKVKGDLQSLWRLRISNEEDKKKKKEKSYDLPICKVYMNECAALEVNAQTKLNHHVINHSLF